MSDKTNIEWSEATWNPITGCSVVSAGCKHCYAMKLAGTRLKHHPSRKGLTRDTKAGPVWTGEVRFNEQWLTQPLKWTRPRKIFVCAHGDLFAEGVPDEWIDRVFAVMATSRTHTFQVLTKRPERMRDYLARFKPDGQGWITPNGGDGYQSLCPLGPERWPLPNVWLGVSVEDQKTADQRIPHLLATLSAIRWISYEPALGPVDFRRWMFDWGCESCGYGGEATLDHCPNCGWVGDAPGEIGEAKCPECKELLSDYDACPECQATEETGFGPTLSGYTLGYINWIVAGGESGKHARPAHPDWFRSTRDQCAAAGIPFLFKQWGEHAVVYDRESDDPDWRRCDAIKRQTPKGRWLNLVGGHGFHGERVVRVDRIGKKHSGRLLDGVLHDAYPEAHS